MFGLILLINLKLFAVEGGQPGTIFSWAAGARSLGLGKAYTAIAEDASATYWNSASLAYIDKKEFIAMQAVLWQKTNLSFLSFALPQVNNAIGFNFVNLNSGQIDKTDSSGKPTGDKFGFSQTGLTFAYAKDITEKFSWGLTTKYLNSTLDDFSYSFSIFDIGWLFKPFKGFSTGLNLQNFMSLKLSGDTDDKIPFLIRLGLGYKFLYERVLVSFDLEKNKNSFTHHIGIETKLIKFLALRLGQDPTEISAGFGVFFKNFKIDYAFSSHPDLNSSHRFSFSYKFGKSINEMRIEAKQKEQMQIESQIQLTVKSKEEYLQTLLSEIKYNYQLGYYYLALEKAKTALQLNPENNMIKSIFEKIKLVNSIINQAVSEDKVSQIVRKSVNAFIEENDELSVNAAAYAYSLQPDNNTLLNLYRKLENATNIKIELADPKTGWNLVEQKLYQALVEFKRKKYDETIKLCSMVTLLEPENATAYKRMGSAFYALGDKTKAREIWKKALEAEADPKLEVFLKGMK